MRKRTARIIALLMLIIAAAFVAYALGHPEGNFPWPKEVTFGLYAVYCAAMIFLFIAPFGRRK